MMCVTTRFRLKHLWTLVPMYLTYRRMHHDLAVAPGLIRHAFLVQSPWACCTFSIWASEEALRSFANNSMHLRAVRRAKRWCCGIWSAYWRLDAVSRFSTQWDGDVEWPPLQTDQTHPLQLVEVQVLRS